MHRGSRGRSLVPSLWLVLLLCLGTCAAVAEVRLVADVSPEGNLAVSVDSSVANAERYLWHVDGKPLSATPLRRASQLILYKDKALPGTTCHVVVYGGDGLQTTSRVIDLGQSLDRREIVTASSAPASQPQPSGTAGKGNVPVGSEDEKERGRLANLSALAEVAPQGSLTAGFVISGSGAKRLLIRAIGPGLGSFGVTGVTGVRLTVLSGNSQVATNQRWAGSEVSEAARAAGAFPLEVGSADAALVVSLNPGAYTVSGNSSGAPGRLLLEVYDLDGSSGVSRLVNLSVRTRVADGESRLIAGFVVAGQGTVPLLCRAVGPGLRSFGVSGTLSNPALVLFSGDALATANDDWSAEELSQVTGRTGAFPLANASKDAAVLRNFGAGAFTAHVMPSSATPGETGEALLEIYEVGP